MTPQEWQRVADELALPWGVATLMCDGYRLTMQVAPVSPLRYEIRVFVNGKITSEWHLHDCEERRRFFRPVAVPVFSPATKKKLLARMARPSKAYRALVDERCTVYKPQWKSFVALKKHLTANNADIAIAPAVSAVDAVKEAA